MQGGGIQGEAGFSWVGEDLAILGPAGGWKLGLWGENTSSGAIPESVGPLQPVGRVHPWRCVHTYTCIHIPPDTLSYHLTSLVFLVTALQWQRKPSTHTFPLIASFLQ